MRQIGCKEAETNHGISTYHQVMDNGEYRFRLLKSDGSAYIRTEASSTGAWQSSHFHSSVKETYIVQSGWIVYAEFMNGERRLTLYRAGQLFTAQPGAIHNVYMPADAVVHTVKHGSALTEDRIADEITKRFDEDTQLLLEHQILSMVGEFPCEGAQT